MTIKLYGTLSASDIDKRELSYLLLPFGEEGNTSAGKVTASARTITLPEDPRSMVLNIEHEKVRPVGRCSALTETDGGLLATFTISKTSAGDDLLVEADDGLRTGVSVEIDNPVIRNGALLGGELTGAGAVVAPAFPSARLVASDVGDVEETEPEEEPEAEEPVAEETSESDTDEETTEDEETIVTTATASLAASAATGATSKAITTVQEFADRLVAARNTGDHQMLAALADITQSGVGGDIEQAQFLNELWSGKAYSRVVVPLVQPGSLTSYKVEGWRWVTKPEVSAYSGNKTAVPSNAVDTEAASADVVRLAGAHDFDRRFADFGDTAFLTSYMSAMTESYARKTDAALVDFLQISAQIVAPGTVPSGVSEAAAAIVDGALAVLDKGVPDYALVAPDLWRQLLLTPKDQTLEYLSMALGLEEGTVKGFKIVPRSDMDPGTVLVGIKGAVQFFELPGVPIRVDAINIANGGLDQGLFGYYAIMEHDSAGIALVDVDGIGS